MIINNLWVEYFVPDEVWNDKTKTVAEVFASAIPLHIHNQMIKVKELEEKLSDLESQDDEILVPNEEKSNIPFLQEELVKQKDILHNLN